MKIGSTAATAENEILLGEMSCMYSQTHSSTVEMSLLSGDRSAKIAHLAPDFLFPAPPKDLLPGDATVVLTIYDKEDRFQVRLPRRRERVDKPDPHPSGVAVFLMLDLSRSVVLGVTRNRDQGFDVPEWKI